MKKVLIAMLLGIALFSIGCEKNIQPNNNNSDASISNQDKENKEDATNKQKTEENNKKPADTEKKYLEAGEIFTATNERGTYEFKVIEAKYLGAHNGDNIGNLRLQIVWDVNNISFNGQIQDSNGKVIEEGIVSVEGSSLKVKDDNGYVLSPMNTAWDGDWMNHDIFIKKGEKAIQKYTWILNNENTEYVYVSYPRMENVEFKIKVKK